MCKNFTLFSNNKYTYNRFCITYRMIYIINKNIIFIPMIIILHITYYY